MGARKYPLNEMVVGDSFVAYADSPYTSECKALTAARVYGKRTGKRFTGRKLGNSKIRIWRIE